LRTLFLFLPFLLFPATHLLLTSSYAYPPIGTTALYGPTRPHWLAHSSGTKPHSHYITHRFLPAPVYTYHVDRGKGFLRNVSAYLPGYTASHPGRP
jgi:hypothetical protein